MKNLLILSLLIGLSSCNSGGDSKTQSSSLEKSDSLSLTEAREVCSSVKGKKSLFGLCVSYCKEKDKNTKALESILANYNKNKDERDPRMPCLRPEAVLKGSLNALVMLTDQQEDWFALIAEFAGFTDGVKPDDGGDNLYLYNQSGYDSCSVPLELSFEDTFFGGGEAIVFQVRDIKNGSGDSSDEVSLSKGIYESKFSGSLFPAIFFSQDFYDEESNPIDWEGNRIKDVYFVKADNESEANEKCGDSEADGYFQIRYVSGPGPAKLEEIVFSEENLVTPNPDPEFGFSMIEASEGSDTIDLGSILLEEGQSLMINNIGPSGDLDPFGTCFIDAETLNSLENKRFKFILQDDFNFVFQAPTWDAQCWISPEEGVIRVFHDFEYYNSNPLDDRRLTNRFSSLLSIVSQEVVDRSIQENTPVGDGTPYRFIFEEGLDYINLGSIYFTITP